MRAYNWIEFLQIETFLYQADHIWVKGEPLQTRSMAWFFTLIYTQMLAISCTFIFLSSYPLYNLFLQVIITWIKFFHVFKFFHSHLFIYLFTVLNVHGFSSFENVFEKKNEKKISSIWKKWGNQKRSNFIQQDFTLRESNGTYGRGLTGAILYALANLWHQ